MREQACAACGKSGADKKCSRCMSVKYCSVACQKQHWKEHKPLCTPPAPECFLFACPVTKEADLPAIKTAVDKHNMPFEPARFQRTLEDQGTVYIISGDDQNCFSKGPPFLSGASLVKVGSRELWVVFKAPYCTNPSAMVVPKMPPAKSAQQHAERSGRYLSMFYPDLCFTGTGCTACQPATSFPPCYSPGTIQLLQLEGGIKDAEHWGVYGPQPIGFRDLPSQLKQMQPTGLDALGDEGRMRALEADAVARTDGDDWSGIAQYLRESPAAGPLRPEEREMVERMNSIAISRPSGTDIDAEPVPLDDLVVYTCASHIYRAENVPRVMRQYPALTLREVDAKIMCAWPRLEPEVRKRYIDMVKRDDGDPRNNEPGEMGPGGVRMVGMDDLVRTPAMASYYEQMSAPGSPMFEELSKMKEAERAVKIYTEFFRLTNKERRRLRMEWRAV